MRLQIQALDFGFSNQLLFSKANLNLAAGENLCLHTSVLDGASSLLKCIAGVYSPISGQVLVDGVNVHTMATKERIKNIAYCYEHGGLISTFSVFNNILFPIRYHGLMNEKSAKEKIFSLAKALEIDHLLQHEPYQLNDVQTRLVNVLRALCIQPKVLLLDEIQAGMSHENISQLLSVIYQCQQTMGFSMIMATTAGDNTAFAERIAKIEHGCIEVIK